MHTHIHDAYTCNCYDRDNDDDGGGGNDDDDVDDDDEEDTPDPLQVGSACP
jgi:hypothetical protein